jgi:hypothetical protein
MFIPSLFHDPTSACLQVERGLNPEAPRITAALLEGSQKPRMHAAPPTDDATATHTTHVIHALHTSAVPSHLNTAQPVLSQQSQPGAGGRRRRRQRPSIDPAFADDTDDVAGFGSHAEKNNQTATPDHAISFPAVPNSCSQPPNSTPAATAPVPTPDATAGAQPDVAAGKAVGGPATALQRGKEAVGSLATTGGTRKGFAREDAGGDAAAHASRSATAGHPVEVHPKANSASRIESDVGHESSTVRRMHATNAQGEGTRTPQNGPGAKTTGKFLARLKAALDSDSDD